MFKTHGMSSTNTYKIWQNIQQRCANPKNTNKKNYGDRGIRVCERWAKSFEDFLADMGPRPSKAHSLDRFPDNNGNYEPGNCRWATRFQQHRNMRSNVYVSVFGRTVCLSDFEALCQVRTSIVKSLLAKGASGDEVLEKCREIVRAEAPSHPCH